jgi:hypothetical protein
VYLDYLDEEISPRILGSTLASGARSPCGDVLSGTRIKAARRAVKVSCQL